MHSVRSPRVALVTPTLVRAAIGLLVAAGIALGARRAGWLATSGAVAAIAVGTASAAAGWPFAALLILFFVSSSLLSRLGADEKARRTGAIVEKGDHRDATQVLANGGAFAALALASSVAPPAAALVLAAAAPGALSAAAADTWATEIGTWIGESPRSLRGWRRVPAGTSGGVTLAGSVAMFAGAAAVAVAASLLGLPSALAAAAGGVAGAVADSLLGASLQERRWCAACAAATERRVHDCGHATERSGGWRWMNNDAVNLVATLVGAAVAASMAGV